MRQGFARINKQMSPDLHVSALNRNFTIIDNENKTLDNKISAIDTSITTINNNLGLFDTFNFNCDSGGARSTRTVASFTEIPGFSGNSITPTIDCQIWGNMIFMAEQITAGSGTIALYINSASQRDIFGQLYYEFNTGWQVQTLPFFLDLDANTEYTLTAYFYASAGTFTVANGSADTEFPTAIRGLILPRA